VAKRLTRLADDGKKDVHIIKYPLPAGGPEGEVGDHKYRRRKGIT